MSIYVTFSLTVDKNILHVAYSHLQIFLKYGIDMLHSGKLGFGDVYLEHLLDTTCIYAQNVSTAQII